MTTMCRSVVSSSIGASPVPARRGAAPCVPGGRAAAGRRVAMLPAMVPGALDRVVTP